MPTEKITVVRYVKYDGKEFKNTAEARAYRARKELGDLGLTESQAEALVSNANQVLEILKPFMNFRKSRKGNGAASPEPATAEPTTAPLQDQASKSPKAGKSAHV